MKYVDSGLWMVTRGRLAKLKHAIRLVARSPPNGIMGFARPRIQEPPEMSFMRWISRMQRNAEAFSGTRVNGRLLSLAVVAAVGLVIVGSVSRGDGLLQGKKRDGGQNKASRPGNS